MDMMILPNKWFPKKLCLMEKKVQAYCSGMNKTNVIELPWLNLIKKSENKKKCQGLRSKYYGSKATGVKVPF